MKWIIGLIAMSTVTLAVWFLADQRYQHTLQELSTPLPKAVASLESDEGRVGEAWEFGEGVARSAAEFKFAPPGEVSAEFAMASDICSSSSLEPEEMQNSPDDAVDCVLEPTD
jgi:hypothetical protein